MTNRLFKNLELTERIIILRKTLGTQGTDSPFIDPTEKIATKNFHLWVKRSQIPSVKRGPYFEPDKETIIQEPRKLRKNNSEEDAGNSMD